MKAEDIAPSPTISRSMLGIRQATMNASVRALAPNSVATTFSRRYPVTRETRVSGVIAEAERTSRPRESSGGFADIGRADSTGPIPHGHQLSPAVWISLRITCKE